MTKPGDPEKGKAAEAEQIEQEAAESKAAASQEAAQAQADATESAPAGDEPAAPAQAQAEADVPPGAPAKPKRARRKKAEPEAEGTAAAETKTEKGAAATAEKATVETRAERKRGRGRTAGDRPVVRAHAKYVRTSARKARLVCDGIRGKSVQEARAILAYSPRAVARDWAKLLESAVANAEHNHELLGDDLRVHTASADEGPTLKRFRPRAMGRATRIRKRTSHLTITLTPKE
jgi:ribosomal protein L22